VIDAYLKRIGISPPVRPDLATLQRIHLAHLASIPFENLDVLLGRPIVLDIARVVAKLVEQRRGGYCFEQNTLFLAALDALGFRAHAMAARVRGGTRALRPPTHMLLLVRIGDDEWLADVGFGGDGPLRPVPMSGDESNQGVATYRVASEGRLRVLQTRAADEWRDLYSFVTEVVPPIDFEMANWFTSTYPESPFVKTLTAQRSTAGVRYVLRYPHYWENRGSDISTREISRDELLPLLQDVFLIDLPADTTFSVIDSALEQTAIAGRQAD
jgi:N-hydroxyarylamine O-acetyltransferase